MIPITRTAYSYDLWKYGNKHNTFIMTGSKQKCEKYMKTHDIDGFISKNTIFISTGLWESVT